jgi:hypothetical protein
MLNQLARRAHIPLSLFRAPISTQLEVGEHRLPISKLPLWLSAVVAVVDTTPVVVDLAVAWN